MSRFFYILIVLFLFSCTSNRKMIYLQGKFSEKPRPFSQEKQEVYRLQPSDAIFIKVQSVDPKAAVIFNTESVYNNNQNTVASFYISAYPLNDSGYVSLPILGLLNVKNLTTDEVQKVVTHKLLHYFKNPNDLTVIVKLVSFKISMLGEVNKPGYYYIYNNQITLLEAIAQAGDLTAFGNRKNIKLIRKTRDGVEVSAINLKDPRIFQTPAYFLQPNDVIYVEPMRYKNARNNVSLASLVFAGLSTLILILNYVKF